MKESNRSNGVKAHLLTGVFQDQEVNTKQTDLPACCKELLRLALVIISNGWCCNMIDVKTTFLQENQIKRDVLKLKLPKEA